MGNAKKSEPVIGDDVVRTDPSSILATGKIVEMDAERVRVHWTWQAGERGGAGWPINRRTWVARNAEGKRWLRVPADVAEHVRKSGARTVMGLTVLVEGSC